jgi:hypothetical protein
MERLRQDVRAAFARQQEKLGDVSGLSHLLVREALTVSDQGHGRLRQAAAGGAALLLAAAVVGALIVVRAGTHPATTPAAPPVTAPTAVPTLAPTTAPGWKAVQYPLTQPLQVAATTPVILFTDPANPLQVDGVTWDGQASGRVAEKSQRYGIFPNPAGTLYVDGTSFKDRLGQAVAQYTTPTKGFAGTWADDFSHYCEVVSPTPGGPLSGTQPTTLQLAAIGQQPRRVAQVGTVSGQTFVRTAACSTEHDRAVVVQSAGQGVGTAQYWVVQLSTGRILWTHSFNTAGTSMVQVIASRDGQYVAEVSSGMVGSGQPTTTTIYGAAGSQVCQLSTRITGFSWDGSLVVTTDASGRATVLRWRDGTTVWTAPDELRIQSAFPEPNGQRIGVVAVSSASAGAATTAELYTVSPDGSAHILASVNPSVP